MVGECRYCGARGATRVVDGLAVCRGCANSPLCDRCGHPRSDHGQVFVRGLVPGCRRVVGDFQTLSRAVCDCEQFVPIAGPLRDAAFAEPDADPLELGLRPPDPAPTM